MQTEYINYFRVQNFKKFEDFEVHNIGHCNLIFGDNNVGKTVFLESLAIDKNSKSTILKFFYCLVERGFENMSQTDFVYSLLKNRQKSINFYIEQGNGIKHYSILFKKFNEFTQEEIQKIVTLSNFPFQINNLENWGLFFETTSNETKNEYFFDLENIFKSTKDSESIEYVPFVPVNITYRKDLSAFYSSAVQSNKEIKNQFINHLKGFVPYLEDIEIQVVNNQAQIALRESNKPYLTPLPSYGFGTVKIFRILTELFFLSQQSHRRLMIDEIEVGVHYERLKLFWKTIIKTAQSVDIQLFASTHSKECIQFFAEVLEEPDMQEHQTHARCINLAELPNQTIKSYTYTFPEFASIAKTEIR